MAKYFADVGYMVDAIDPRPPADAALVDGITFHQTTLEEFEANRDYDLVVASPIGTRANMAAPSPMIQH